MLIIALQSTLVKRMNTIAYVCAAILAVCSGYSIWYARDCEHRLAVYTAHEQERYDEVRELAVSTFMRQYEGAMGVQVETWLVEKRIGETVSLINTILIPHGFIVDVDIKDGHITNTTLSERSSRQVALQWYREH